MSGYPFNEKEQVTLCEAIDRILNKGAVIVCEATISVANVDLIYIALQAVITSVETSTNDKKDATHAFNIGLGTGR